MNFKEPILEKIFKRFKWTRNITIELFDTASAQNILHKNIPSTSKFEFQPIIYQFQCIITTTDRYIRTLTNNPNQQYGVCIRGNEAIKKHDIIEKDIKEILKDQLEILENILKEIDSKKIEDMIDDVTTISDHEYLHQGELILMFRQNEVDLPERMKKAWAL